ncbi:hypothetical protein M422DRAFT_276301, partial [Sphaerobolus stellatus SS14]
KSTLGFKDTLRNIGAGDLSTLELRAFVLGGAPTDEVPKSSTPADSAVNKDTQRCNRCHKWLPLELFPRKASLVRTKRCKPCTDHEVHLQLKRKARNAGVVASKENIDPGQGTAKSKLSEVAKKIPTIRLINMESLLEAHRDEAF